MIESLALVGPSRRATTAKMATTALVTALALGGCASFNNLTTDVSTFGPWPAGRQPSTYVFERLPSQQVNPQHQIELETAARGALEASGFHAVADPNDAEYLMQLGARVSLNSPWIYNEPLFFYGGWRHGRYGRGPGWGGYGAGFGYGGFGYGGFGYPGYGYGGYGYPYSTDHEVAIVIRDRKTGQLLYEARSSFTGGAPSVNYLLSTMFNASMKDFPNAGPAPHEVTVPIAKR